MDMDALVSRTLWDVFEEALGPVTNKNERGRRNRAISLIGESLEAEEIPPDLWEDELRGRIVSYRQKWPNIELTEMGIANNWKMLDPQYRTTSVKTSVFAVAKRWVEGVGWQYDDWGVRDELGVIERKHGQELTDEQREQLVALAREKRGSV